MTRSALASTQSLRAAFFDFEGTLVDFQWRLAEGEAELRRAFAAFGYEGGVFTSGSYSTMWNAAVDLAAPHGRFDALRLALDPVYDRWDADALTRWTLRPGAATLLRALWEAGVEASIVSNIGRAALDAALERFGIAEALVRVVSRNDVTYLKPHAEGTLRALSASGAPAAASLFVGDSLADVHAARGAGMSVAIIRGGECDAAAFRTAPPDRFVSRLDEIADGLG